MNDRTSHWDSVYSEKRATDVSWFQVEPEVSLKLIRRTGVSNDAPIVDVGGGASTLVDHLLAQNFRDVSVLDIAAPGLEQARGRLGERGDSVSWIVADVTAWRPSRHYRLWHDRAVLHFLTSAEDQAAYVNTLRAALEGDGWLIIGGFAPGGPVKCSGLPIVQHDAESLYRLLGDEFRHLETHSETHVTPWGSDQAFRYHLFQRRG